MSRCIPMVFAGLFVFAAGSGNLPAEDEAIDPALLLDEVALKAAWQKLNDDDAAAVTLRHLRGLVRAAHKYHDVHGSLPPAVVPNPDLPPAKRLSGLVLLLPHLNAADVPLENKVGKRFFDDALAEKARQLYQSIDLKKAWDDPANDKAARTLMPAFLLPDGKPFRDDKGYAVSHIAFVRGAKGEDDGAFNETEGVTYLNAEKTISDGTVNTFAFGQISDELGPWIAAGTFTARYAYHPSDQFTAPTFGSGRLGCYFVNCDSFAYFLDVDKTDADAFHALATRAGGELVDLTRLARYNTRTAWKKAQ